MSNLITVKNLSIAFNKKNKVVDNISFSIPKGKTVAIVGESGSGKTVTAMSILKLLPNSASYPSGEILFKNNNILKLSSTKIEKIRGNKITAIFQEPMLSLNPLHTIDKQISEILITHSNISLKEAKLKTKNLLKEVGLEEISSRPKTYSYELSGGQRQRVMIAMSIANNPDLLIADEPTTALDVSVQMQILELLKNLQEKRNMSILFISHDLSVVKKMANYICVMKNGKIIEQDNVEEIFSKPKNIYTKQLVSFQNQSRESFKKLKNIILTVNNVKVWYPIKKGILRKTVDYVKAIEEISFELNESETIGIVGESGSGKTSLILAILKLIDFKGQINIDKLELSTLSRNQLKKLRKDIQIVFQDPFSSLSPRMTIEQIVSEGLDIHFSNIPVEEKSNKVKKILKEVGLNFNEIKNRFPHEFSGGQRQRIAIARALILNPKILILDEPTSALDVTIQKQIIDLLNELQKKYSMSYLFISHDMKVIRSVADKIIVLQKGKIVEQNTAKKLFESPKNPYTKNLISGII